MEILEVKTKKELKKFIDFPYSLYAKDPLYVPILKKEVSLGGEITSTVGLINLGVPGKINASIFYQIKDQFNEVVYNETEIVLVETQIEFIKTIDVSKLTKGNYRLIATLNYSGQKQPAQAEDTFTIVNPSGLSSSNTLIIYSVLIISISVALVLWIYRKLFNSIIKKFFNSFA